VRDYTKEDYTEIDEALPAQQISEEESSILSMNQKYVLLSDHIIELINLFLNEVKKISTADSVIKLFIQFFRAVQLPVFIVDNNFQTLSSNLLYENIQFEESNPQNLEQIFSKEDIAYLKKNIKRDDASLGPLKSIQSNIGFMIYSYPFKSMEKDHAYNLLILKSTSYKIEQGIPKKDQIKTLQEKDVQIRLNEIYKTLLDTIDGFYFVTDRSLRLLLISGQVYKKLGYDPGDLAGLSLDVIIPSHLNFGCYNELKSLNQTHSLLCKNLPIKTEILVSDCRGVLSFYELNVTLFNNETSDENYIICTCIDIQERKIREKALEEDKSRAEQKDQMKSEFLSNMSHEIRTPLNGIIGFSAMLDRENLDKDKRDKYMKIIRSSSRQLLTLINDIIDFSKIEAAELKMYLKPSYINQIIDELYTAYSQELVRLNKENIKLKKVEGKTQKQIFINTDEMRLQQVFINLMNNACKFTTSGEITFGYTFINNNENKIRFFVKDTGIGIPEAQQERIFDRFRQTKEGEKPKYKGTGLGLAISKGIVELLGSQLKVDSKLNVGSEFYFIIYTKNSPQ
jgi:PAS domain S-box-containing protein